jgi:3-oxoacyl-[acyl-carrier-protein] synthase III
MLEGKDFAFLNRVLASFILKNGKKLKEAIEEISEETNVKSDFIKTILLKAKNRNIVSFYNSKFLVLPETFLLIKILTEGDEYGNG